MPAMDSKGPRNEAQVLTVFRLPHWTSSQDYLDDPKLIDQLEQGDWHLRGAGLHSSDWIFSEAAAQR